MILMNGLLTELEKNFKKNIYFRKAITFFG